MLAISGEGLKTLDAVRGTFETLGIEPTVSSFEAELESGFPAAAAAGQ